MCVWGGDTGVAVSEIKARLRGLCVNDMTERFMCVNDIHFGG